MLTGGEAHDCPAGMALIKDTKPAKLMLGDKGYDGAELRAKLKAPLLSGWLEIGWAGGTEV